VRALFPGFVFLLMAGLVVADDIALQAQFNRKYKDFLARESQAPLPLPQISKAEWKKLLESQLLQPVYTEPERFYNSKTYTFTMYQDGKTGSYYLDAKGGFWGMDELVYGPMSGKEWE
jgi:hypothetical protein